MFYQDHLIDLHPLSYRYWATVFFKNALIFTSCCWDVGLYFLLCMTSLVLLDFEGFSFRTHLLIGLMYLLTVGRRAIFFNQKIFSPQMIPCATPAYIFCILLLHGRQLSHLQEGIEFSVVIALSRWPLFFAQKPQRSSLRNILKNLIFFSLLQVGYGLILQCYQPSMFEALEWRVTGEAWKPGHRYPSATKIQLFYEDVEEAEKIEAHLPEVLEILKSSPFYQNAEDLVFIQKNHHPLDDGSRDHSIYPRGSCQPIKQFSYYFTASHQDDVLDPVYYSHHNTYRSIAIHELTHQLLSRYYRKWPALFLLDKWKNEGYAEYMTNQGCYHKKDELLAMVNYPIPDEILASPFSRLATKSDQYCIEDYMAAFLQTLYALDVKKISPIEFMQNSYQLASAQEIKQWLMSENLSDA